MVEALKAAFLGLIQGITEFFPISSSAHLRALREILGFEVHGMAFDIAVHLATLFAVLIYFRRVIVQVLRGPSAVGVVVRLGLASIPLFVVGYLFGSFREQLSLWVLVVCWILSGTYLLLLRGMSGELSFERISIPRTFLIGVAQSAAFLPGMSRSGSTIAAGIALGLNREEAARFSFLLAIPAILGAGAYECIKVVRSGEPLAELGLALGVAMPIAFATGMLAIHWLLRIIRGDRFYRFGWYNLGAALVFAAYLALS